MKILNINRKPIIRSYTYHLFPHSIVSSKDKADEKLAKLEIIWDNGKPFCTHSTNAEFKLEDNFVEQYSDVYEKQAESFIYHAMDECDELSVKIEYQQQVRPWAVIYSFIKQLDDLENQDRFDIRFGNFCNQTLLIDYNIKKEFIECKHDIPYWLKLRVRDERIM